MNALQAGGLALLLAGGLQACCFRSCHPDTSAVADANDAPVPTGTLDIVNWGPRAARAGAPFDRKPGGHSTLWIRVAQPLDGRMGLVQFGDMVLEGRASGHLLTARVPPAAYASPGRYEIRAIARTDDALWISGAVSFTARRARPAP